MIRRNKLITGIFAALVLLTSTAQAASISWSIDGRGIFVAVPNGLFAETFTITGSFNYHADLDIFSNLNFVLTETNSIALFNEWSALASGDITAC